MQRKYWAAIVNDVYFLRILKSIKGDVEGQLDDPVYHVIESNVIF